MAIAKAYDRADLFALTRATKGWRFDPAGDLAECGPGVAREDYDPATLAWRGWLIEAPITNHVPNPLLEGASVGVFPTGMAVSVSTAGLTIACAGTGIESRIPYVDIDIAGTASNAAWPQVRFFPASTVVAVSGEAWFGQCYARVISGGALPSAATLNCVLREAVGSTTQGAPAVSAAAPVGTGALREAILPVSLLFAQATTDNAQLFWQLRDTVPGLVYNHRIRIGAPQLWRSSLAFSPSFPEGGSPGAFARAADDLAMAGFTRWADPTQGTFCIDFMPGQTTADADRGLLLLDDGTTDNRVRLRMLAAATTVRLSVDAAGSPVVAALDAASGAALVRQTVRFSFGPHGYVLSVNGGAPVTAAGAVPPGLTRALVGRALAAGEYLNGWIGPRFDYFPKQYTDAAAADGFTIRTR